MNSCPPFMLYCFPKHFPSQLLSGKREHGTLEKIKPSKLAGALRRTRGSMLLDKTRMGLGVELCSPSKAWVTFWSTIKCNGKSLKYLTWKE